MAQSPDGGEQAIRNWSGNECCKAEEALAPLQDNIVASFALVVAASSLIISYRTMRLQRKMTFAQHKADWAIALPKITLIREGVERTMCSASPSTSTKCTCCRDDGLVNS